MSYHANEKYLMVTMLDTITIDAVAGKPDTRNEHRSTTRLTGTPTAFLDSPVTSFRKSDVSGNGTSAELVVRLFSYSSKTGDAPEVEEGRTIHARAGLKGQWLRNSNITEFMPSDHNAVIYG